MAKKIVGLLFLVFAVFVIGYFYSAATNRISIGYNDNYMPDQPLPFSHETHAGKFQINCQYCHSGVEKSRHASVPSLNICMNCHRVIKVNSPHIQKLTEAFENNKPIKWKKVHLLPDFVKFNHAPHVIYGKQCKDCHGQVEKMPVVYQEKTLSMGFCIECHRKPENNAPTNCSTCHY